MDNKYFINNVAKILSEKTGKKTSETDSFLKELGLLFNECITNHNFVKIKGIGAFKVVQVRERESINVNTGERFLIPLHNKLSFIPEKKMKDMINKPFALFEAIETQEDSDGLINLIDLNVNDVQEFEEPQLPIIEEIPLPPSTIFPVEQRPLPPPPPPLPPVFPPPPPVMEERPLPPPAILLIEDNPLPPPMPSIEEKPVPPPIPYPRIEEKPISPTSTLPIDELPNYVPPAPHTHKTSKHSKAKNKKSFFSSTNILLYIVFFLLFILIASAIYYFFFYNRSDVFEINANNRISKNKELVMPGDTLPSEKILEEVSMPVDSLTMSKPESSVTDTTKQEGTELLEVPAAELTTTAPNSQNENAVESATPTRTTATTPQTSATTTANNNVFARVRIERGQRLTLIAERYYGNKVFWVYIYEFNKAKIGSNPNNLRIGMEILVPAKELYGIDANNAASIDKATDIQREIMETLF